MQKRFLASILLLLPLVFTIPLYGEELTLTKLLFYFEANSPYYKKAVYKLEESSARYKLGKMEEALSLNYNVPVDLSKSIINKDAENMNETAAYSTTPGLSFSQKLPTAGIISGRISDSITDTDSDIPLADTGWQNTLSASVSLQQPLFFENAFKAAQAQLDKTYENSKILFEKIKNEYLIQGIHDYYTLKQMKLNTELTASRLTFDSVDYKKAEKKYSLGMITKSQLFRAKAVLLRSKTDSLQAKQEFMSSYARFKALYRLNQKLEISSTVKSFPTTHYVREEFLNNLPDNNPDILTLKNTLKIHKNAAIILKKDHAPVFSLSGDYSFQKKLPNDDTSTINYSATAAVSASLFDGGRYRESLKKMDSEQNSLENDLNLQIIQVRNQAASLLDSLSLVNELIQLNEIKIGIAQYAVNKGKKDLELGQITKGKYQLLERDLENALLAKQQNIIDRNLTCLKLDALKGDDISVLAVLKE